ncbi:YifB family Mg chelatase-like AAA ATPase [Pseudoduganella chitinolytica]|uniref:YifB family Mg chelatase-like AAA ATPase n=1 Tax=Pseudoduganella chitinolytica TaxID=34070 RepID=A0ABY8B811_9BURK|nr:YifB family Mg chelatase-like AAA ATPase [Pseudoduganella chitinolytica]WEF31146.1 YifB family Mg chelatase-like AAA ATPase [Pseudoduganella chitinolytica]
MSLAVIKSRALAGMEAPQVSVEVHLANGLPAFHIVGLAETEVKEARDRVRAAILTAGFDMPQRRITVSLAPADLPKESGRFDLPIALGILAASGQIPGPPLARYEFAGELSLTGELRPIRGALAMTFAVQRSAGKGGAFVLPCANADEAALVSDVAIYPAASLLEVCNHFRAADDTLRLPRHRPDPTPAVTAYPDFADVKGQQHARRALEVAAAGGHSALLLGPPGAGKTMLASRFTGILPPMTDDEALEAAAVQSLTGVFSLARWKQRPFRAPHHTSSAVALVGGGSVPRPGEISLAHCGVLFLDELPEFERRVLEVLRQPLESGQVTISRAARQADFPARFQLIAAMNPCPCGFLGHPAAHCRCTPEAVARYQSRISGPLLDRIDIQLEVGPVSPQTLLDGAEGESSAAIAARVAQALRRQLARQHKSNCHLSAREIDRWCAAERAGQDLLHKAMLQFHWSARAYHRVLRVARTIADLAGAATIGERHVAEAIQLRRSLHQS